MVGSAVVHPGRPRHGAGAVLQPAPPRLVDRPRRPHPADAASRRSWSGVMWRAMLNPDWGIVNWASRELGLPTINWLGSIEWAMSTLVIVDTWQWTPFVFIIVFARLQALPQHVFEAAQVDGAGRWATFRHITLPLLMPAIVFCGDLPGHRRVPVLRPDLRAHLRRAGALDDDAQLLVVSERLPVPALRLLGGRRLCHGRRAHRRCRR